MRYRYMYSSMVPQAVRLYVLTTRRAKFSQFAAFAYCLPILRAGGGVALCQPLDISSGRSQKAKLASEHIEFHPIRRNNFLHLPRHHRCPRSLRSPHYSHRKNADLSFVAPPSKFPLGHRRTSAASARLQKSRSLAHAWLTATCGCNSYQRSRSVECHALLARTPRVETSA